MSANESSKTKEGHDKPIMKECRKCLSYCNHDYNVCVDCEFDDEMEYPCWTCVECNLECYSFEKRCVNCNRLRKN